MVWCGVGKHITLSIPARVEVVLGCDNNPCDGWTVQQELIIRRVKVKPLRGPSCKLRLFRSSAKLRFQDGPSVAISESVLECLSD